MELIIGKKGNQPVPITEPTVSRKHCKVTVLGPNRYQIENLSQTTYTRVDGKVIVKTTATLDSKIELGPVYKTTLRNLISGKVNPEVVYSIAHLKKIWDSFNQKNIEIDRTQRQINLIRSGGMIFTMGGGFIAGLFELKTIGMLCAGIGVVAMIISFLFMKKTETYEQRQKRIKEFKHQWVCPNPKCGKSINQPDFDMLVINLHQCPHCKCKYVV